MARWATYQNDHAETLTRRGEGAVVDASDLGTKSCAQTQAMAKMPMRPDSPSLELNQERWASLTNGEGRGDVLDLHVVEDNRLRTGIIYKLTFPNGKAYVGLTTQELSRRMTQHKHCNNNNCRLVARAIGKYGWANVIVSVMAANVPLEELGDLEIRFISELNTLHPNGYNLQTGGEGGWNESATTKRRKAKAVTESWKNPVTRDQRKKSISKTWQQMSSEDRRERNRVQTGRFKDPGVIKKCEDARRATFMRQRKEKIEMLTKTNPIEARRYREKCKKRDQKRGVYMGCW